MQFTVFDLTQAVKGKSHKHVYDHLFDQVRIAEEGGLDAYYITEHHFDPGYNLTPSPNVVLGAMSQRTSRIRLGTMTTVLTYHHPVRAASEIRELDLLTGGRLDLAFGRGAIRYEQQGWGVPRNETSERFEATFHLVKKLLVESELDSYESPWWKGGKVHIVPEATQKPLPPMWLTAVSETSMYKAGRLGLNICTAFRSEAERVEALENYRAGWDEFAPNTAPGLYQSMSHIFVAENLAEAEKYARPHLEGWLDHFVKVLSDKPVENEEASYETHKRVNQGLLESSFSKLIDDSRIIYGTVDDVVDQLVRQFEGGIDVFQGYFQFGELDFDASNRSLKLFCDEVVPRVRARIDTKTRKRA
jgi:alkanesulfonate monooxygenase SsuD/methylene tetrahydromethanopterin reductase-like flavin-dependent oxidoreductase (luciferase family)